MNNKLVIELHVGKRYGASRLNCDENGKIKSILINGKKHSRISSQAKKAAWRSHFIESLDSSDKLYRTRALVDIISNKLKEKDDDYYNKNAYELATFIANTLMDCKTTSKKDNMTAQLVLFSDYDIEDVLNVFCEEIKTEEDFVKYNKDKNYNVLVNKIKKAIPFRKYGIECALFGRMTTSGVLIPVESAMSVNHSIALGRNETEMDYFTAIDNYLSGIVDDAGAAHINRKEFASSVYYEYASIDVGQLYTNLCHGVDMTKEENKKRVKEVLINTVKEILFDIVFVAPTGAQNAFASSPNPVGVYSTIRDSGTNKTADSSIVKSINDYSIKSEEEKFISAMDDFTNGEFSDSVDYIDKFYIGENHERINANHANWSFMLNKIEEIINEKFS